MFSVLFLFALLLVACVQPEKKVVSPTRVVSPVAEQLQAEVLEQEQAPDGLDEALRELQELEEE